MTLFLDVLDVLHKIKVQRVSSGYDTFTLHEVDCSFIPCIVPWALPVMYSWHSARISPEHSDYSSKIYIEL